MSKLTKNIINKRLIISKVFLEKIVNFSYIIGSLTSKQRFY